MSILKFFNPALFIILIVCFLLPFVRVSCGDEVLVDATGMDIVTGTDYSDKKDKDNDNDDNGSDNYRYIMIIVFGITILGLILSVLPLIKELNKVSKIFIISMAVISLLSFILLIVYVYLTDKSLNDTKNVINFKLMYGFFVLEAFYLITAVVNILILIFPERKQIIQQQVAYNPTPSLSKNKICIKCGAENVVNAAFCKNCGNQL